jgi:hypothetical protein
MAQKLQYLFLDEGEFLYNPKTNALYNSKTFVFVGYLQNISHIR